MSAMGPPKQHDSQLATLELLQNVCEAADKLAVSRCGKRSKEVLIQSAALRGMQQQWADRQQQIAELRGGQVFSVASALHTVCNRLDWCQRKLHQSRLMRIHALSSRQQAAHVLKVLSAAQEAYLNFETAFRLAHVLSRQQAVTAEHVQLSCNAPPQRVVAQQSQPTMCNASMPVGNGGDPQGNTADGTTATPPVSAAVATVSLAPDHTTSHDDVIASQSDVNDVISSSHIRVTPSPGDVTQVSGNVTCPAADRKDAAQPVPFLCTSSCLTGTSGSSDVPSAESVSTVWPPAGCSLHGNVQAEVQGDLPPSEHPKNSRDVSSMAAGVLPVVSHHEHHPPCPTAASNMGSVVAVWDRSSQGWEDLLARAWQGDGGAVLACAHELLLGGTFCWQDTSLARQLLSTAVQQSGNTTACLWLGQLAEQGVGLPTPDREEAAAWYGEGAALGDAQCAVALGFCYQHGLGIAQDTKAAEEWYECAVGWGSPAAMNNLAQLLLAQQISMSPDRPPTAALQLLTQAAGQGSQAAWYNLGVCHELGLSGLQGHEAAAAATACYQQAGSSKALERLALLNLPQQQEHGQLSASEQALGGVAVAAGSAGSPGSCCFWQGTPRLADLEQEAALQCLQRLLIEWSHV